MSNLIKTQLMVDSGKTFYYRNKPIIFLKLDQSHNDIRILVEYDGVPQEFVKETEEKLGFFLQQVTEISQVTDDLLPANQQHPKHELPSIYLETSATFKSLTSKLLDDIDKVRQDASYVPQAKQVCNNVSTIVNITRLQMQLVKDF